MRYFSLLLFLLFLCLPMAVFSLIINEVCSSNDSVITDYYGRYSDWIELRNNTSETINLNLYCLSDNLSNLTKFRFPVGSTIAPGQIILVWAVNEPPTIDPNGDFCGTNFAVSAGGEPVVLSLFDGLVIVDQMPNNPIPTDVSYGRVGTGTDWYYFIEPTPRTENTTQGYTGLLSEPIATQNSGWFMNSVTINFTTPQTIAQIRYTTDGSLPSVEDPLWTGPLTLFDRSSEPNIYSMIPTVLPNLPEPVNELDWWFPPLVNIPKIHTIKARCFADGALASPTLTRTYLVGINLYDLPVVSLSMDPIDLFDNDVGIYVAGNGYNGIIFESANFMQNWERPVVSDWFDVSGNLVYQKQSDVEIHGIYTARAGQKSLRLKTPDNPSSYFNYPFFGNDYLSSFRNLILRNSGNDVHMTLFRDNFVQTLLKEQNLDVAKFVPYIVFLNGEYWGIHNLQEHMQENWISGHYNIPLTQLDVIERNLEVLCGDNFDYIALLDYLQQNDETDPVVWQYLETKIDLTNFREYMAGEIYSGNTDWPGNNIRYWRKRVPYTPNASYGHDGRWRWLVYDMDFSYGLYQNPYWIHNTLERALSDTLGWRTFLLRSLVHNNNFRNDLINTLADRLNYNWQPVKVINSINQYEAQFQSSIPQHIERWSMPSSMANWHGEVNALRTFALNRPPYLQNLIVNQFGLSGTANLTLDIQPPGSAIVKMNNRVDLPSGNYIYFQGIPITMKAIPAPNWEILSFGGLQTDSLTLIQTAYQTIQIVMKSTGNADNETIPIPDKWSFVYYPNPVYKSNLKLNFTFTGAGYKQSQNLNLEIYNVKGQRIELYQIPKTSLKSGTWDVALTKLSSGLYIFRLVDGKSVRATKKVLML